MIEDKPRNVFLEEFLKIREKDRLVLNLLKRTLSEGDEVERWTAVKALGDRGGESAIEILERVSKTDPSPKVRGEAIHQLSFYVDTASIVTERANKSSRE